MCRTQQNHLVQEEVETNRLFSLFVVHSRISFVHRSKFLFFVTFTIMAVTFHPLCVENDFFLPVDRIKSHDRGVSIFCVRSLQSIEVKAERKKNMICLEAKTEM